MLQRHQLDRQLPGGADLLQGLDDRDGKLQGQEFVFDVGQRGKGRTPEEGCRLAFPEIDLKDGDEIELRDTVFRVGVADIPSEKRLPRGAPDERM